MRCSGATSVYMWEVVMRGMYIFKNVVFKKRCLVMAWKKIVSKRAYCQVCMYDEI
jgi:hypothetical protein